MPRPRIQGARGAGPRPAAPRAPMMPLLLLTAALAAAVPLAFSRGGTAVCAAAAVSSAPAALAPGARGPAVFWLQARLGSMGVYSGPVTGYFGVQTQNAVMVFQRSRGLTASGVVGPATARALTAVAWTVEVRKGDTLAAVSTRLACTVAELMRANPKVINPDRIYAGQRLNVPVPAEILALAQAAAAAAGDVSVAAAGTALTPALSLQTEPPQSGRDTQTTAPPQVPAVRTPLRVALTFNDGPDPAVLPLILDILKQHSVPATFFFTGRQVADHPDLVREVVRLGHTIECHGWRHEPMAGRTHSRILAELRDSAKVIADLTGRHPTWFRPPGGENDQAVYSAAARAGLKVIWWHNIGRLPSDSGTAWRLDRYFFDGAVIMLPAADIATPGYLGAVLERGIRGGACFCRLDESLGIVWGW